MSFSTGIKEMATAQANPIPDGFHTVTPYLVVSHATGAIEF